MPTPADPLSFIISAGGAVVGALSMLVWTMLLARVNRIEKDVKEVGGHLVGDTGMTVKITDIAGRVRTLEAEVNALKAGTLSREIFERATNEQNSRLDELKVQTKELGHKVDRAYPRSYSPPPATYDTSSPPARPLPPRK